ncbi:quinone oxidoreductase, partial [Mycobacterium kansasii]
GSLRFTVGATYPLAEAGRAHTDLQARRTTGSVALLP